MSAGVIHPRMLCGESPLQSAVPSANLPLHTRLFGHLRGLLQHRPRHYDNGGEGDAVFALGPSTGGERSPC